MNYTDLVKSLATDDVGRLDVLLTFLEQNTNVVITPEKLQEFIDSKKILPTKFIMEFETDWDFSIKFRDKIHSSSEFTIRLSSVEELDEMEVMGAFGSPKTEDTKCWELEHALEQIKANPNEDFSNMGGNRGVSWTPITSETTST